MSSFMTSACSTEHRLAALVSPCAHAMCPEGSKRKGKIFWVGWRGACSAQTPGLINGWVAKGPAHRLQV
eukprot:237276-Chlamydomonas_euryale.AAC.3